MLVYLVEVLKNTQYCTYDSGITRENVEENKELPVDTFSTFLFILFFFSKILVGTSTK